MARSARHPGRWRPGLHVLLWFTAGRNPEVTAVKRLRLKTSSLFL
jgi:hypothetical protein